MAVVEQLMAELAAGEELARLERFKRAWQYYHGEHPAPLKVKQGAVDDTVAVNYARVIVDKGVGFLFGQDVGFELLTDGERDPATLSEPEAWLAAAWRANRRTTTLQKLALNGGVCGHAFLKLVPQSPYPRLIVLDPATVTVRWDPDDIETVVCYRIQYAAIDPQTAKLLTRRQLIERDGERWTITDQVSRGDSARWETTGEALWPWRWAPLVDCQNLVCPNEFWGVSDLEDDVLGLNRAASFVLSNLLRIVRWHAHPRTWGKGFDASQLRVAVDEIAVLPSADGELHNLEMASDLASSVTLFREVRQALHELSRVPEVATGTLESVGQLSALALKILYGPLLEKTEAKRISYGELLVETNRRLLALGGFGEEQATTLQWPELLPSDPKGERETLLLDRELGASADTLLRKAGYDPLLEREKRQAESAELGDQLLAAFDRGASVPGGDPRADGRRAAAAAAS